jgi:hypothetical protein
MICARKQKTVMGRTREASRAPCFKTGTPPLPEGSFSNSVSQFCRFEQLAIFYSLFFIAMCVYPGS